MSSLVPLPVTHTSTVTPEQIDELGHMNVRFYGLNAVAATKALCGQLGLGEPDLASTYTRHHHEQMEGDELQVHSAVLPGTTRDGRLRIYHELRNHKNDDLAATFVHELAHPPLDPGSDAVAGFEMPDYGRPRSLSIATDALAAAPALSELRSRDLAIRLERTVDTEDADGADTVPSWLANNLIWGGERPDGDDEEDWIQTDENGHRVAFATMESRLWIGRLPALGTHIQSFGCVVAVADKVSHGVNWAFDLDTEEPLAVFEVINLAFNITERRSMVMSPNMRSRQLERLHPDLAIS